MQKTSKLCVPLFYCLFMYATAYPQQSPFWEGLNIGEYKVGYRVEWKMDHTRSWGQSELAGEGHFTSRPYGRPVRIATWYPSTSATNEKAMRMKDYLYVKTNDATAAKAQAIITAKDIGDASKSIKGLFSGNEKEFEKFLNTSSAAKMNVAYVKGKRFPLLIYSSGQNDYTFENIILFEYLASHGFVVVSVPHLGVNPRKDYLLVDEALSFETQVRDLEFALSETIHEPFVDNTRIGAVGMSFGSIYSLLLAARNPNIKALAGLDGTVMGGLEPFAYKYWQSPFYDSCNVKIPVLQLFREGHTNMTIMNSLKYCDKYLMEVKGITHADFTSYPVYTLHTPAYLLDSFAYTKRTPVYAAQMFGKICSNVAVFFQAILYDHPETLKQGKVFMDGNVGQAISTRLLNGIHSPNEEEFARLILNNGLDSAVALYRVLEKKYDPEKWLRQRKINRIGYEMVYNNKIKEAIEIFKFNVEVFPGAADVYDSLGEGYMIAGNKEQAIKNYERSLALNPQNEGAKKAIQSLRGSSQ